MYIHTHMYKYIYKLIRTQTPNSVLLCTYICRYIHNIIRQCLDSEPHHWNWTNDYIVYVQYVIRHCLGGTNNHCSTTSLQVVLSQRTRNAIITSLLHLILFRRKWHYLRRVSVEMLLINTYWYEKPRANISSNRISITELWIPIINSWIHMIQDNRENPQLSYGYNYGYPKFNHGYP